MGGAMLTIAGGVILAITVIAALLLLVRIMFVGFEKYTVTVFLIFVVLAVILFGVGFLVR
jgi:hypothetical protein